MCNGYRSTRLFVLRVTEEVADFASDAPFRRRAFRFRIRLRYVRCLDGRVALNPVSEPDSGPGN